jgi:UDP-N-acetylglucosamine 2-epimerase (non-hydrolysing)
MSAKFVLTDSGGIQEETTFFGVPCLTIRENTERPITVDQGTNILVGTDSEKLVQESLKILDGHGKQGSVPEYWDDRVSKRIVEFLKE